MSSETEKTPAKSEGKSVAGRRAGALTSFDEMDRMFDSFFGRPFSRSWLRPSRFDWPTDVPQPFEGRTPSVDLIERENELVIKAELPGVKKEDLSVKLSNNTVTIRASTKYEAEEEKGDYHRRELSQGEFVRNVALPAEVDGEKATAKFKDGLLELTMPKLEAAAQRNIEVE